MNFHDIDMLLQRKHPNIRDYTKDTTSGTPTVGVHEKNLPHDLTPLSFKDMMRHATPDYDSEPEQIQNMQIGASGGFGPVGGLTQGIRPQYDQTY